MRILIVGATGTIGWAVAAELGPRHEIVAVGRTSGDLRFDISNQKAIRLALQDAGKLDAVVSVAGHVKFGPFVEMHASDYEIGLHDKLMGQVNLVLVGRDFVSDGGSFTLTDLPPEKWTPRQGAGMLQARMCPWPGLDGSTVRSSSVTRFG